MRASHLLAPLFALCLGIACSESGFNPIEGEHTPEPDTAIPHEPEEEPQPSEDPVVVAEPVADAGGDQTVQTGESVRLDGSGSTDPGGLVPLSYQWVIASRPPGSTAVLDDPTRVSPTFTADVAGSYAVTLVVYNSAGVADSTPDRAVIRAEARVVNEPIANAGPDQTVDRGESVRLDASASTDPDGLYPLTYRWSLRAAPSGASPSLSSASTLTTTFSADRVGDYEFDLTVGNSAGVWDSSPDRIIVRVTEPPPREPIADAGPDQSTQPLRNMTLDGTASYDPGGSGITAYRWTVVSVPAGSTSSLSSTTNARPTFFADLAGDYIFDLSVKNGAGVWDSTPDRVVVRATPADGFYVELSWNANNDLDLHLLNGTSALFGSGDCAWCRRTPSWGTAGTHDDPSLDWDAIYGYGPETTTITVPSAGSYEVKVHYYGMNGSSSCGSTGCSTSSATVRVYLGGTLARTFTRTMSRAGELWNVARIEWPSGAIVVQDTLTTTSTTQCF